MKMESKTSGDNDSRISNVKSVNRVCVFWEQENDDWNRKIVIVASEMQIVCINGDSCILDAIFF